MSNSRKGKALVDYLVETLPYWRSAEKLVTLVKSGDPEARKAVIKALLSAPGSHEGAHSLDEKVCRRLLRASGVTSDDPQAGLELARDLAADLIAPCEAALAWGIQAQAYRMMGDYKTAEKCLAKAWEIAGWCEYAVADLLRRRGVVRFFAGRRAEGLADAEAAVSEYRRLGCTGHDLHGEGLAKSLMERGQMRWYLGDRRMAISDIGHAVSLIPPKKQLFGFAVGNLAVALKNGSLEEKKMAMGLVAPARRAFQAIPQGSLQRAKLDWMEGMLRWDLRRGKRAYARFLVDRARLYFIDKNLPVETLAVTADLFRMDFPDRTLLTELVTEWWPSYQRRVRSPELRRAFGDVEQAAEPRGWDARRKLDRAISALRAACKGANVMPCLLEARPSAAG